MPDFAKELGRGAGAGMGGFDVQFDEADEGQGDVEDVLIGEGIVDACEGFDAVGVEEDFVVVVTKGAPLRAGERAVAELRAEHAEVSTARRGLQAWYQEPT